MSRWIIFVLVVIVTLGCRLPPEVEVSRSPSAVRPVGFVEVVRHARLLTDATLAAFYADRWTDMEEKAVRLEETVGYLSQATNPPISVQNTLASDAEMLRQESARLTEAARERDEAVATQALQRIFYKVRTLIP